MEAMGTGDCPAAVAGTAITSADGADGMAMTFTNPRNAEEVRKRVHAMADRMNERSDAGGGLPGMMGAGGRDSGMPMEMMMGGPMMGGSMPAMQARVEDTASGATLVMTPADPSKAQAMRDGMQQHARMMSDPRGCP
jgi:hypothetical protein